MVAERGGHGDGDNKEGDKFGGSGNNKEGHKFTAGRHLF